MSLLKMLEIVIIYLKIIIQIIYQWIQWRDLLKNKILCNDSKSSEINQLIWVYIASSFSDCYISVMKSCLLINSAQEDVFSQIIDNKHSLQWILWILFERNNINTIRFKFIHLSLLEAALDAKVIIWCFRSS